jgi:hypothetical protein
VRMFALSVVLLLLLLLLLLLYNTEYTTHAGCITILNSFNQSRNQLFSYRVNHSTTPSII